MVPPIGQTGWKWTKTAKSTERNKKISKKVAQVWKITIFDRHTALFNGASMGAIT
jgi:hypothetical protein